MSRPRPIEYADASPEVRAVFDDIKSRRKVEDVNNFWKYLANDPALLKRTWETQKEVLAPGALDPLVKELLYLGGERHERLQLRDRQPHSTGAEGRHDGRDVRRVHGGRRHGESDESIRRRLSRADRCCVRQVKGVAR